ncbi:CLK4-associating serine/arginine rich protein-like isoform X2 [Saccoglossus kowalevskii]
MWHEARKQERKLRGMMVDYKKRAERRREYYEKIKLDPTQFIRLHGRPCKINLDPAVAMAAEGPGTMMPWQGDAHNLIDRFDVRAHLDYIPEYNHSPFQDLDAEERKCNYERYRTLVQSDWAGITEEQFLYQIYLDELFGAEKKKNDDKERLSKERVSIGYVYDDSTTANAGGGEGNGGDEGGDEEEDDEDDDSDIDIDIDIDIDALNDEQTEELNITGVSYGMNASEYIRQLRKDKEELEALKRAREEEEERAMYSGRKSRRERRALIEKRLKGRKISPPSYARRDSPTYQPYHRSTSRSSSRSRSRTPENAGEVKFITSFGGDEDEPKTTQSIIGPMNRPETKEKQEKVTESRYKSRKRTKSNGSSSSSGSSYSSRSRSRSRERDRYRYRNRRYSRSRSRERRDSYRRHPNDRYSYHRRNSYRSHSRSRSRDRHRRTRSRSPIRSVKRYSRSSSHSSRSRSRSKDRHDYSHAYDRYRKSSYSETKARIDRKIDIEPRSKIKSAEKESVFKKREELTARLKVSEASIGKAPSVSASSSASAASKVTQTYPTRKTEKKNAAGA